MFKQICTIIIFGSILFALQLFAFTEPSSPPPGANTAAPLHVGSQGQTKTGGLILNTGGATYGLIVQNGFVGIGTINPSGKLHVSGGNAIFEGNVGIGTTNPAQALEIVGSVKASSVCLSNGCRSSWPEEATPPPPTGSAAYTSTGTYSWTVPDRVTRVTIEAWGAGGGGGSGSWGYGAGGGGGGGGAYGKETLNVSAGSTYSISVGAGGTRSPNYGLSGTAGGQSCFGSVCAGGGGRGLGASDSGAVGGGAGGTSSASVNISGTAGQGAQGRAGGRGGSSGFGGAGGAGGAADSANSGGDGGTPGGGGGGGGVISVTGPSGLGGNGGPGRVIINW